MGVTRCCCEQVSMGTKVQGSDDGGSTERTFRLATHQALLLTVQSLAKSADGRCISDLGERSLNYGCVF